MVAGAARWPREGAMGRAYGGDLLATPRSSWDPETHREIPFDWRKVASKQD